MQDLVLIKVESALQSSQVAALAGQTATVSKVSAATNLATLVPDGGQAAVTVKLDAARQVAEMKALLGKSVLVGKSPAALGGAGNWISLLPAAQAKAGAAAGQIVMLQVEGGMAAAQLPGLVGQTVTVAQPQVAAGTQAANMLYLQSNGNLVGLKVQGAMQAKGVVGNSYMVMKSPVIGGTVGKYVVLQPFSAMAGKAAAGGAIAAKFVPAAATTAPQAAAGAGLGMAAAGGLMSTGAGTVSPIAAAGAGSSMLGAKGVALGLGLGAGAWGPVVLGIAGLVGAVSVYSYVRRRRLHDVSDDELLAAATE
jgi:hypothetical protein